MNIARKIGYNFFVSLLARVIGMALALISLGLITRTLGVSGYGQYSLVLAFLMFFQILADFGLQTLLVKELSKTGADEKKIASNFFTLKIAVSFVIIGSAPLFALLFPYSQNVKLGILLALFGFLFLSLSQIFLGIFQKFLRTDKWAIAELANRVAQLALFYVGFKMGFGLFWFLFVLIVSSFLMFVVGLFFARRLIGFSLAVDFSYWRKILKDALPIGVSLVFTLIYFKADTIMLGIFKAESDVGIYNLAYRILESLIVFAAIFVGLIFPLLSEAAANSLEKFKAIFQKTFDVLAIGALPIVFGGWILAGPIVAVFGGRDFVGAESAFRILLPAAGIIFFGTLAGNSVVALNQQKKAAWAYGIGAIFNVGTNLIFIPKYSYLGAAATTVATEFIVTAFLFWLVFNKTGFFPAARIFVKSVIAASVMLGVLYLLQPFLSVLPSAAYLAASLAIGTGVYCIFIFLLKGVSKMDLRLFLGGQ